MTGYAELAAATNYSFLHGASHPCDMVGQAVALGMAGIGIADRNSVAGVVRAYAALRDAKAQWLEQSGHTLDFRLLTGARLVFADGTPDIVTYPSDRAAWGRLTRLLTLGNRRAKKGDCILTREDLVAHAEGQQLIVLPSGEPAKARETLVALRPHAEHLYLGATMHRAGRDRRRLLAARNLARETGASLIAVNDVLYASPDDRPLHDVLTCIREHRTLDDAGRLLAANAERHLKSPDEMVRLFADAPEAVGATQTLLDRVNFTLEDLRYEYPHEPVPPGWEPQDWLEHMVMEAAHRQFPDGIPPKFAATIDEEFRLIRDRQYAYYFLTVHDIVRYARSLDPPILCQGRGSAANSVVCYLLGVTPIDPVANQLLFTRFLSEQRDEPPDIDVDFEHERREEVMQYIYGRYGRDRAGIAATVIHYRQRSAIREVGKVLGLTEDITARLSGTIWGSWGGKEMPEARLAQAGLDAANPKIERLKYLIDQLLEFPRHLSQHVGGFVLTEGRLDEIVPIHNGAMPDRTFVEWDKDDLTALGLMKVDVLALGMLTAIRKCLDLIRDHDLGDYQLKTIPPECPKTYAMLRTGDSIGTFQVESRAQINMLPRMKPKTLYDLVIQVAIVRPGPIQGGMVHPYLRRRNDEEKPEFPSPDPPHNPDELKEVLGKTLGVPLFQEQAMKLAIVAAGFPPADADGLRRAMATFRNRGTMHHYQMKMVEGMVARGYDRDFATRCFDQIKGFGEYGFPESHAQAFGYLAYVSSWLKCHQPAAFTAALLNSQPMGFYAPAQLVQDARDHGVEIRPVDVFASAWDNSLEGSRIVRLGFRQISGFREDWAKTIVAARPCADIALLARHAKLPLRALTLLADADALHGYDLNRRDALWNVLRTPADSLPLFAAADARELGEESDSNLPGLDLCEEVVADYSALRLSLKGHPMQFLRTMFAAEGVLSSAQIAAAKNGAKVKAAGVVLVRQRPGKGNAVFITIEDESGIVNALLWARLFEVQRAETMGARLMVIEGEIQRSKEGVVHLMATRIHNRTAELDRLSDAPLRPALSFGDEVVRHGHPRNVRILPKSRDFH